MRADRLGGAHPGARDSSTNLDEDKRIPFAGHEIELAPARPPIAREDYPAALPQVAFGFCLGLFSQVGSREPALPKFPCDSVFHEYARLQNAARARLRQSPGRVPS